MVSLKTDNDLLCFGVWNADLILNYLNFYSTLSFLLLSICSNLFNLALVIQILVNSNEPNLNKVNIY